MPRTGYAPPPIEELGIQGLAWRTSAPVMAAAIFFVFYLSWRPAEILYTLSDALFMFGAFLVVIGQRMAWQPMGSLSNWWLAAVAVMLAGLFIGSIAHGDPDRWLIVATQYLFSLAVLPMLLLSQPPRRTLLFMKALLAGIFCMELFGVLLYFGYDATYEEFKRFGHDFVTGARRLGAFLGDANWNAAAITLCIPFVIFLRLRHAVSSLVLALVLLVLAVALVLSASVTGLFSCILSLLIFGFVGRVRPSTRSLLVIALLLGIAFASGYGLPRAFANRVAPALESGDVEQAGTFTARMDLMRESWGVVEHTSLVGLGVDQYRKISVHGAPVHNIFMLLWAEGGLLALIGWLTLMTILAVTAWLAEVRDRLAAALAFSVLSTFIVFSSSNPHMYARLWMVPLMLAMAPAFAAASNRFVTRAPPLAKARSLPLRDGRSR